MKKKWNAWCNWQKINFGMLALVIIVLLLGLIIIGATNVSETKKIGQGTNLDQSVSYNRFDFLTTNSISNIWKMTDGSVQMQIPGQHGPISCLLTVTGIANLKAGIVFAVILTPILAATTIGSFGYYYYQQTKKTNNKF